MFGVSWTRQKLHIDMGDPPIGRWCGRGWAYVSKGTYKKERGGCVLQQRKIREVYIHGLRSETRGRGDRARGLMIKGVSATRVTWAAEFSPTVAIKKFERGETKKDQANRSNFSLCV